MEKKKIGRYIGLALSLVIVLWLANLIVPMYYPLEERGIYGDMFGAVNSFFSGLAFAGIIIAIILQSNELRLQREELKLQREELKLTRQEFKQQNETLAFQRFENTFFNLLSLHHEIVNSIDYEFPLLNSMGMHVRGQHENLTGRDMFKRSYEHLEESLHGLGNIREINTRYLIEYDRYKMDYGHYFRNLYRIFKMIDEMALTKADRLFATRYKYTSIVRAQLSDYELLWLSYNCVSDNGKLKFKPLVKYYAILKNIDKKSIFNKEVIKELEPNAFKLEEKYRKMVAPLE